MRGTASKDTSLTKYVVLSHTVGSEC
uniref:Uncharacterized protein n=1 Tax=Anguilla anguilla TaxID=7936 RepID=A0A0E9S9U0_ANGAN